MTQSVKRTRNTNTAKLTKRVISPGAEEHLGKPIKIGEHGFVELIDYMGSDASIAYAARMSYQAGTKTVSDDRGLIRYLVSHEHTTPQEYPVFVFKVRAPIFVARQWMRHRAATYSEESARYSLLEADFFIPETDDIQLQSKDNKQGRKGEISEDSRKLLQKMMTTTCDTAYKQYQTLLEAGVARELGRMVLPVNIMTQFTVKMDAKNLMHFIRLRMDEHAQKEIRDYATVLNDIVKASLPIFHEAMEDYVFNSVKFSYAESFLLRSLIGEKSLSLSYEALGILIDKTFTADNLPRSLNLTKREKEDFQKKLASILTLVK